MNHTIPERKDTDLVFIGTSRIISKPMLIGRLPIPLWKRVCPS